MRVASAPPFGETDLKKDCEIFNFTPRLVELLALLAVSFVSLKAAPLLLPKLDSAYERAYQLRHGHIVSRLAAI